MTKSIQPINGSIPRRLRQKRAQQVGAFCYRDTGGDIEFLLVTSSNGRWILPKGWPMPGLPKRKVAKIEAWEEAGVRKGKVTRKPVIKLKTKKQTGPNSHIKTTVAIFAIKVKTFAKAFPEDDRRQRKWVTTPKAMKLVKDKRLRKAICKLAKSVAGPKIKAAA